MSDQWAYEFTPRTQREWRAAPPDIRRRIIDALDTLADDRMSRQVRKLQGVENEWRLRVGDWRIRLRFNDAERIIVVVGVLPRDRAYRN